MNCKDYKKWIIEGDEFLSSDDKIKLENHLNECSDCRELYQRNVSNKDFVSKLAEVDPELTYPDVLTANIMKEIIEDSSKYTLKTFLVKMLDILFSYRVRTVAYSLVIIFVGLFAYQQHFIINKLEKIEKTVETRNINEKSIPTVSNRVLKQLTKDHDANQISVDKDDLDFFIDTYKDLKTDHDKLLEVINDNMPLLEKKLSNEDLDKLRKLLESDIKKVQTTNL